MIGEYEQTIREQVIAARRRLFGKPERAVVVPPPDISKPDIPTPKPAQLAWQRIIAEVAAKHGVTVDEIKSKTGAYKLAKVRHEAAYRLVVELGMSYHEVGRHLGGRDHSVAKNAMRKHVQPAPRPSAAVVAPPPSAPIVAPKIAYAGRDE